MQVVKPKQIELGQLPSELEPGVLPESMQAWVIRQDREGAPLDAFQLEEMPVPEPGATEVVVLVMAAGVNYNNVWAALGKPVSVFRYHAEDHHIGGSDASGIVWKVGSEVERWKPGDEVVVHCNQSCGQCPECNGQDPMACSRQQIWGYETTWGSFAQFCKVQSQQLVPKPQHLTWEESASYALTYFTAYRMLIDRCDIKPGDNVLVWGAGGGLGIFAVQLCRLVGANAVAVVSSDDKAALVRELGAAGVIDRRQFDFVPRDGDDADQAKFRTGEVKRLGKAIREITGGDDCNIVFEHVGRDTFPTSVFLCSTFGKIVICGATTGFDLNFDVRHLWMRQKSILGSHFANAFQATRANRLIVEGKIRPVVSDVLPFSDVPRAHDVMWKNQHAGKMVIRVQAPSRA
ncbi:MAG: crotonyl-CoA carboxylase/reductase [Candidatus Dormibacteria bacterium]